MPKAMLWVYVQCKGSHSSQENAIPAPPWIIYGHKPDRALETKAPILSACCRRLKIPGHNENSGMKTTRELKRKEKLPHPL